MDVSTGFVLDRFNTSNHNRSFSSKSKLSLQIITSSHFEFECCLDFCLLLNMKLNICTKFVLQCMYSTSFAGGIMIDIDLE